MEGKAKLAATLAVIILVGAGCWAVLNHLEEEQTSIKGSIARVTEFGNRELGLT